MRAESFLGQVVAVMSRRTAAFIPASREQSTFPGQLQSLILRHKSDVPPPAAVGDSDTGATPPATVTKDESSEAPIPAEDEQGRAAQPTAHAHALENDELLTPAQVASIFHVDPKTITRWARTGRLKSIRTLGGHRRYRRTDIQALLEGSQHPRSE
jgi:excisionase family DNA binding protein